MGGIAREQDAPDPIATRHPGEGVEELRLIGASQRRAGRNRFEPRSDGPEMVVVGIRLESEPPTTVA
jgi:hypothetical protein